MNYVFRLVIRGKFANQTIESTFHYTVATGQANLPTPYLAGLAIQEGIRNHPSPATCLLACYVNAICESAAPVVGYEFISTTVTSYPWNAYPQPYFSRSTLLPTGPLDVIPGPGLPPQVSVAIKRRLFIAKRWAMGRVFMPAPQAASVRNGILLDTSTQYSKYVTLADRMIANLIGSYDPGQPTITFLPGIVRKGEVDPVDNGPVFHATNQREVETVTRAQRRRIVGVGI